jgi:type II secretory pathway pseudopilin PulG
MSLHFRLLRRLEDSLLHHKRQPVVEHGFTLVESVIVMALAIIIGASFYTFFRANLFQYLHLQADASNFTQVEAQTQRISSVVRGMTGLISASSNDLQMYAYFYPQDSYVSQTHYYLNTNHTQLLADVTAMTANPPIGTPISSSLKTYVIIDNFKESSGTNLFNYYDASNTLLASPIADLTTPKAIQINLAVVSSTGNNQILTMQVTLRNRKTSV